MREQPFQSDSADSSRCSLPPASSDLADAAGASFSQLLARWRSLREGWSPILSQPPIAVAFAHLAPAVSRGHTVLDVGSGPGHIAGLFGERGANTLALDWHFPSIRTSAERHPDVLHVVAQAEWMPLADDTVDAIFCASVLQYTTRELALEECRRVLRPGGRFAFIENLHGNPLARLYRVWNRFGARYQPHMHPRAHIRWRERDLYRRFFPDVRFDAFHIVAPVVVALKSAREAGARSRVVRALFAVMRSIDVTLFQLLPGAGAVAHILVVSGSADS